MVNFDFDFYEIVVWVATIALCLITVAARSMPLKATGGLGQDIFRGQRSRGVQPLPNPISLILAIAFFTAFAGLRRTIGDTYFYMYSFEGLPDSGNVVNFDMLVNGEGFSFIQNILRNYTSDPQVLIFVCTAIAMIPSLIFLYAYSSPFDLGIYLFVAYGYLGGMMDGMRQYMAASFVMSPMCPSIFIRSRLRYATTIAAAATRTRIILLPPS